MPVSAQSFEVRRLPGRCGLFSVADTDVTSRESTQHSVLHITKAPWLLVFKVLPWWGMEILGREFSCGR